MAGNLRIEKIEKHNIFKINNFDKENTEIFQDILSNKRIKIERIISSGQKTPDGKWLCENKDEWVILLKGKAKITFRSGSIIEMKQGDYLFINSGTEHRVTYTSSKPRCVWLAIHGDLSV
jgi:cupin 2 domain-containing protein